MRIDKLLKDRQTISFEFFPPKDASIETVLFETIARLSAFEPDFVSITYGAGGSTRDKTFEWTQKLDKEYKLNSMMHLTCYGNDYASLKDTCDRLVAGNINNALALRGDPPKNMPDAPLSCRFANELVAFMAEKYPEICVGVAGYPEKHPQAPSFEADIYSLKRKLGAGASFIITQLFFDNELLYRFRDKLARAGVNAPLIAGLMPVTGYSQLVKFTEMCGATIPVDLRKRLEAASDEDVIKIGVEHALKQTEDLLMNGINGIHFYTLNRHSSTYDILTGLKRK